MARPLTGYRPGDMSARRANFHYTEEEIDRDAFQWLMDRLQAFGPDLHWPDDFPNFERDPDKPN